MKYDALSNKYANKRYKISILFFLQYSVGFMKKIYNFCVLAVTRGAVIQRKLLYFNNMIFEKFNVQYLEYKYWFTTIPPQMITDNGFVSMQKALYIPIK